MNLLVLKSKIYFVFVNQIWIKINYITYVCSVKRNVVKCVFIKDHKIIYAQSVY